MDSLLSIIKLDEQGAREYLERVRWQSGRACPHCGERKRTNSLNGIKDKKGQVRLGLYKCYACRKQFTVTTGTVMHRSHLTMQQWIAAYHLVSAGKKGVAALEIQRVLGIGSYESAWYMVQRIREAMKDDPILGTISGLVEVDETYIGGKARFDETGRSVKKKTPVVAMIERDGSAVARPVRRVTAANLKGAIREVVDDSAIICTDEFMSYKGLDQEFVGHVTVNHSEGEYARGLAHINSCESFFATMKRGVHGTYHSVSKKHLARYCDEFAFRWSTRKVTDCQRAERMIATADRRITYKKLIGKG